MRLRRILFAHAFFLVNDEKQLKDKFKPYPPLATLYAASVARAAGQSVSLFDAVLASGLDDFRTYFLQEQPDLLIIYEDDFNFLTKMCLLHVREAALAMIDFARDHGVPVAVHSSDASDHPALYLQRGARYVIRGEGEETLLALLRYLDAPASGEPLPGGLISSEHGILVRGENRKNMRDINELPFPAWDLVEFGRYRDAWLQRHGYFSLNLVSSRGCPYKCNWCAKPIWGQQYVSFAPQVVARQLHHLKQQARPDHIWFADDIFGLKKDWILAFSQEVEALDAQVPFTVQSRADLLDRETAHALRQAGCEEVWLGVESGSQMILDKMDKELDLAEVVAARQHLHQQSIRVGFFIQLGYPGEGVRELSATRDMLLSLKPDAIGVSVSYPLPGTGFHDQVRQEIRDKANWLDSDDLDAMFFATFTSGYYREIRTHLHDELKALHAGEDLTSWRVSWLELTGRAQNFRNPKIADIVARAS